MSREDSQNKLSRRDVLKTAGTGVVAGCLAGGCSPGGSASPAAARGPTQMPAAGKVVGSRVLTHRAIDTDVAVVGGGMSGLGAAIAAVRNGASVVLVQDRPMFGGNSSSEVRMHTLGADGSGAGEKTDARESGIVEELRLEESVKNPQMSYSMWDLVMYEWVKREPRILPLLNSHCCGVGMAAPDRIGEILVSRHGTEELFTIRAKQYVDCTGDGRVGAEAGAESRWGREAQGEYGESMAPPQADRKVLGSSILFVTRQHDRPIPFVAPSWIRRFPKCEDLPHRSHGHYSWGFWWVEFGGELDTIKDGEGIRDELLAAALGVWDHIKNSGQHPDSANWALDWIGFVPGKRESRRLMGDYVLRQQDVQAGEMFEDGVAYGGWPIDLHPPEGIYSKEHPCIQVKVPLYNIPFRCLYSKNVRNLLMAGRVASMSHVAFGSTRVMATCCVMGQAAGTAAAMCAGRGAFPRELGRDGIKDLQQQLLKDDAYIIGATNNDPADLARKARVKASSELAGNPAANVINGV
ncbi:MAG TPA: FAD-dependent oxidoreductase, partial [Phycisphaerae bacterium]|nr:FAD-dependent oxidoreductase [Phycisphaerae bacterium]